MIQNSKERKYFKTVKEKNVNIQHQIRKLKTHCYAYFQFHTDFLNIL